tara:strand:+ start:3110 stop:4696 length:1587 start_codon:yes stop_codon:yes gene_type:complete
MSRKLKEFLDNIAKFNTYFHVHGGDVIYTILSIIFVLLILSFLKVKKKSVEIKKNWPEKRCDPGITPFAGLLNPPPGSNFQEKIQFTMDNYALCNSQILKNNVGFLSRPVRMIQEKLKFFFSLISIIFAKLKLVLLAMKELFDKIAGYFFERVYGIVVQLQVFLVKIKDILMKSGGVAAGLFLVGVGSSYLTIATLNNFAFTLLIVILIMLVVTIVFAILTKIPFIGIGFIPPFIISYIIYIIYSMIATLVAIYIEYIKYVKEREECMSLEGRPDCCFHPNTTIKTQNGYKQIKDLKINDELDSNNFVESIQFIKAIRPLYSYGGIFVTGEHYVYDNNELKMVKKTKDAQLTNVKCEYYFCIQTTKKYILINDIKFADWDDMDEDEKTQLKKRYSLKTDEELSDKFNSGIRGDTKIELNNGKFVNIGDIKVGDVLKDFNIVVGKVKVRTPVKITNYISGNKNYFGYNLYFKNLGNEVKKIDLTNYHLLKPYYHLITTKKYIEIENKKIGDFNWTYDTILDKHNELFFN